MKKLTLFRKKRRLVEKKLILPRCCVLTFDVERSAYVVTFGSLNAIAASFVMSSNDRVRNVKIFLYLNVLARNET